MAQLHTSVLDWLNRRGRELRQGGGETTEMQLMRAHPSCTVTAEVMSAFEGRIWGRFNVFVISRFTSMNGAVDVGIHLATNDGQLIKSDEANCCAVYFQRREPEPVGHIEAVVDKFGRHQWKADGQVVRDLLWKAVEQQSCARTVHVQSQKQIVAAHNRINRFNETINVGDCAWLFVPSDVVNSVRSELELELRSEKEPLIAEHDWMLIEIARIITQPATAAVGRSPLPTQQFEVWTGAVRIDDTFSIDKLKLCSHLLPNASIYRVVGLQQPTEDVVMELPQDEVMTFSQAYKRYLTLRSTRAELTAAAQVDGAVPEATAINSSLTGSGPNAISSVANSRSAAASTTSSADALVTSPQLPYSTALSTRTTPPPNRSASAQNGQPNASLLSVL